VPQGYEHSYWSYVLKLAADVGFSWYDFRKKYMELGGDGIYGAWQLTYLEPAFRNVQFAPTQTQVLDRGLCPVAEAVQPHLLQFKTNYFDLEVAKRKAEALAKTIAHFAP
jgi:perosamine synthetase